MPLCPASHPRGTPSAHQITFFNRLDAYHTPPDSGEHQFKPRCSKERFGPALRAGGTNGPWVRHLLFDKRERERERERERKKERERGREGEGAREREKDTERKSKTEAAARARLGMVFDRRCYPPRVARCYRSSVATFKRQKSSPVTNFKTKRTLSHRQRTQNLFLERCPAVNPLCKSPHQNQIWARLRTESGPHPTPYALDHASLILHLTPYTLHTTQFTIPLHTAHSTLKPAPTPYTVHRTPYTLHPNP